MISATYFGEVTELKSRAVWYSDEEDDDDDDSEIARPTKLQPIEPVTHEKCRSDINLSFKLNISTEEFSKLKFSSCVISLASVSQFKLGETIPNTMSLIATGHTDPTNLQPISRAYAFQSSEPTNINELGPDYNLWLVFDSSHSFISGHLVGYLTEALCRQLQIQFNISEHIIILSQQFSSSESLEYLTNNKCAQPSKLSFQGDCILPPSLIRNHFEAALFEILTLSLKTCTVVCLPNPRDSWFNTEQNWPTIPKCIVDHRLFGVYNDLDKSLIFI